MKKYPVVSEKGNKYLIEINRWLDAIDHSYSRIDVHLYKVERKWFSKKMTSLYFKKYKSNTQEFYDFVLASKNSVIEYETSSEYFLRQDIIDSEKKFKKWNGIIT